MKFLTGWRQGTTAPVNSIASTVRHELVRLLDACDHPPQTLHPVPRDLHLGVLEPLRIDVDCNLGCAENVRKAGHQHPPELERTARSRRRRIGRRVRPCVRRSPARGRPNNKPAASSPAHVECVLSRHGLRRRTVHERPPVQSPVSGSHRGSCSQRFQGPWTT
jgi:hypothetical protein